MPGPRSPVPGNWLGVHFALNIFIATTIPWLLLRANSTEGPGVFQGVTFIQRLNTVGGTAPTTNCDAAHVGQEARVSYTAEYWFYREE